MILDKAVLLKNFLNLYGEPQRSKVKVGMDLHHHTCRVCFHSRYYQVTK